MINNLHFVTYFENEFGFGFKNEKYICFFGNAKTELPQLHSLFPSIEFFRVKQTHSDIVVESKVSLTGDSLTEADAHWTSKANKALLIATADCMPIMIYCKQTNRAAAVHAGWRGVVKRITEKTLQCLIETGSTEKNFDIFIGPSIQQESFEVDSDVYEKLILSTVDVKPTEYSYNLNNKYYINLNKIVLNQIDSITKANSHVSFSEIDTKKILNYRSYRRDKLRAERNLSFICLLT